MNIRQIGFLGRLTIVLLLLSIMEQPVAAAPPTQEPTPPPDADVLFEDDFSDPGSGWETGDYAAGSVGYRSGAYYVTSNGTGRPTWGVPYRSFDDFAIAVDATQISTPPNDNTVYGVVCRARPDGAGYYLLIRGDGSHAIAKAQGGSFEWLADWQESAAIHRGNVTNHVRAVCDGEYLALFVNGELLAEASDTTFSGGDIALTSTSYDNELTEVHFDNLLVTGSGLVWYITPDGQATVIGGKAVTLSQQGDFLGALGLFQQSLALWQEMGVPPEEAWTLKDIAAVHEKLYDYEQALDYYQEALTIFREVGDQTGEAVTLNNMGGIYRAIADYEQALDYYQQSLPIRQEIGDREGEAKMLSNIGSVHHDLSNYEQALAYYQQALNISQEIGDQRGEATTLNNIGMAYLALSDYERALDYFQQALPIQQEIGDRAGMGTTLNNTGLIYEALDYYEQALDYYEQALTIRQEVGDRAGEAVTLGNIGGAHHALSDYAQALLYYQQALEIAQEISDRTGEARMLNDIGTTYRVLSDYPQALACHQQALEITREIGDRTEEGRTLNNTGSVYKVLSDYEQALTYYEQALAIGREIGNRAGEAGTLNNIGTVYDDHSDYEQALTYYQEALTIDQEIGNRAGEATTLGNIGVIYLNLGAHEQALAYALQALPIQQETGDRGGEAATLSNIGAVHFRSSDYEQALAFFQQALNIAREIGIQWGEATILHNIGRVYNALADYEQALTYDQQALSIAQDIGNRYSEARVMNGIGTHYKGLAEYEQALAYSLQALPIQQEIGDQKGMATTLNNIGQVYEQQGDETQALAYYLQSIAVRETLRAEIKVEAFQIALAGQDVDVYQSAVRLLVGMGRTDEAFNLSERNRARAFLDAMGNNRPDVRQSGDATLLHQEETLHGELAALESSLLAGKSKSPDQQDEQVIRSIETQLTTKQQEYGDLLARLQLTNPELASLVTVPTTTVTDTQALLDDQTTLVAYYLTDENVLASILTHDDFQMVELPASAEEIARAVENFRRLGLANLGNPHLRSLSDLYTWLVAPLKPYLSTPKVGIIPHQALHYVPFAALSDGEQYFGEQFILFQLPSASALPFIQAKTGREPTAPLVLGDPQTDNPDLPRLDYAAQEAEAVAGLFGAESLVGTEASEEALSAQVGTAGMVHLAAHGSFNPAAPLFSRLWLAPGEDDDGHLNVHEVYGLDLQQADLVVLSACQTQLGELSAGDEVVGLNRAFLYGAPTVVASLWSVDDEATGTLMVRFYTHLLAGMGKAEALQAAQNETRTDPAHPEWAHTYYWAAFVLSGDAGTVSATSRSTTRGSGGVWVLAVALAAVLLLGLTVVIFIRVRRLSRR